MENVIIVKPKEFLIKKKAMIKDGMDKLHVVSDFDRTLTYASVKGEKSPTVIAQLREGKYLSPDYVKRANELSDIYRPIEKSNKISFVEKSIKMQEWWKLHFELLIESGLDKKVIIDVAKNSKLKFREGSLQFLESLNNHKIPLIIISAAPGDILIEYFKNQKRLYENILIIANYFNFDKDGKAISVKEPNINSLNKHEIEIKKLPIYKELLKRKNVILLGDNIEDIGMIEGFPYKNLIKIGFLNENINENLEVYKKNYDVVIINDIDMEFVNGLVKEIICD